MQVNNTPSYFVGLTPEERRMIVLQAAKEQEAEIKGILDQLFVQVDADADGFTGALGDVARAAVARNKPKVVSPAEFWNKQEEQRKQNPNSGLALSYAPPKTGLLAAKPLAPLGVKPVGGQGPLAFAQRGGVTGTPKLGGTNPVPTLGAAPQIGFPKAAPIKTINLSDIVGNASVTSTGDVVGNLIDIFA
jgi:hypothetical protein